jgi:hypothetical protein
MKRAHAKAALHRLLQLALPAVEALPPSDRADLYDGIAAACRGVDAEMHQQALNAAQTLREASSAQMSFRNLLS